MGCGQSSIELKNQSNSVSRTDEEDQCLTSGNSPGDFVFNPTGLIFYSLMNSRNRFFLPSTQNTFGGVKVEKVMCDTGCNSILLPLTSSDVLQQLNRDYAATEFHWKISKGKGAGGHFSPVLLIEQNPSEDSFEVSLMSDKSFLPKSPFTIKRLRFQLCFDDYQFITSNLRSNFIEGSFDGLNESSFGKRKNYALLGQDILQKYSCIRHGKIAMYVDVKSFKIPSDWKGIGYFAETLKLSTPPEGFKDWEDDDQQHYEDEMEIIEFDDDDYFDE